MHIFLKQQLKKTIKFNKIGMTIRPLNEEERDKIMIKYDTLFLGKEAKIKLKIYQKMRSYSLPLKELTSLKLSDEEFKAGYIYESFKLDGIPLNKSALIKQLNKIAIIEFNEQINEYIEEGLEFVLASHIFKSMILKKGDISLSDLKNIVITSNKFDIFSDELLISVDSIFNYINKSCPKLIEIVDLKAKDFNDFEKFINVLTRDRIRDFILISECIFTKETSNSNSLLNYVSSLERLLVKYEKDNNYDIGKQIVLKFGLCISDNSDVNIEEKLKYIKYCYQIRSCIVHGNENDLLKAPMKYLKMTKEEIIEIMGGDKIYKTRFLNIWLANNFLENNITIAIKEWIDNPKRIEFLKNN